MIARRSSHNTLIYAVFIAFTLLLSACQQAPLASTSQPTDTPESLVTQQPAEPTDLPEVQVTETPDTPSSESPVEITLDFSDAATNVTIETIPANPASAESPFWEAGSEYRLLALQDYPVAEHMHKPQIFIYPAADLAAANENVSKIIVDLQALLKTQEVGDYLPFLPLFNAQQVMHAQVQFLDFKSGKGVRYLTQFDQAPLPVNNNELFYTFQGLTSDGKYYIAAVLPVTNPELPEGSDVSEKQAEVLNDFPGYLSDTADQLNQQPPDSFTPDLNKLDELIQSVEVN